MFFCCLCLRLFPENILSEGIAQQSDFDVGRDAFVEDVIYGVKDGHVYVQVLVDVFHALCAEISLGYHFHFQLCALYAVAIANHGAKHSVATEIAVARNQKVAGVYGVGDVALNGVHRSKKTVHLLYGVADEHGLEIVSVL
jgi:hypothetical protein